MSGMTTAKWAVISGFFAILALVLFGFVIRSASAVVATGDGVIAAKTFKPAGTFTQVPVGIDRKSWTSVEIPIAEAYIFEIRVDGLEEPVYFALNTVASRAFEIGARVRVQYRERGIPFAAKKYLVLEMSPS
jgi:hypothetical protein